MIAAGALAGAPSAASNEILVDQVGLYAPTGPDDPGVGWATAPAEAFFAYYAALRAEHGIDRDAVLGVALEDAVASFVSTDPARFAAPPLGLEAGLLALAAESYDAIDFTLDGLTGAPLRIDRLGFIRRGDTPQDVVAEYVAAHESDLRDVFGLAAGRGLVYDATRILEGHFIEVAYRTTCGAIPVRDDSLRFEVTGPLNFEGEGILQAIEATVHPDVTCPYTAADLISSADAVAIAAGLAGAAGASAEGAASLSVSAAASPDRYLWQVHLDGRADAWLVDAYSSEIVATIPPDESLGVIKKNVYLGPKHGYADMPMRYVDYFDDAQFGTPLGRTNPDGSYDVAGTGSAFLTVTSTRALPPISTGGVDWTTSYSCTGADVPYFFEFTPGTSLLPWTPGTVAQCFDPATGTLSDAPCTGAAMFVGTPDVAARVAWALTWERDILSGYGGEIADDQNFVLVPNGAGKSSPCSGSAGISRFSDTASVATVWHEGVHDFQHCANDGGASTCGGWHTATPPLETADDRYNRVAGSYNEGTANFFADLWHDLDINSGGGGGGGCDYDLITYKPDHRFLGFESTSDTWGKYSDLHTRGTVPTPECTQDANCTALSTTYTRCGGHVGDLEVAGVDGPTQALDNACTWACTSDANCPAGLQCDVTLSFCRNLTPCASAADCPTVGGLSGSCNDYASCSYACAFDADCTIAGAGAPKCGPRNGLLEMCHAPCTSTADCAVLNPDPSMYCDCSGNVVTNLCVTGQGYGNGSLFTNVHRMLALTLGGDVTANLFVDTSAAFPAVMEYASDSVESFHTRMTGAAAGNAKYEVSAAFKRTFLNAGYAWKDDYTDYVGRAGHFEIGAEDFTSHTISSGGPAGLGAAGISYSGDRDAFLFRVTRGESYTFATGAITGTINTCLDLYKFPGSGAAAVLVTTATNCADGPATASITYTVPTSETARWFALVVRSTNAASGTYNLTVTRGGSDGYADALAYWEDSFPLVIGSTTGEAGGVVAGDADWFKFFVPSVSASTMTVHVAASGWTPHIDLYAGAPGVTPALLASATGTDLVIGIGGHGTAANRWFYAQVLPSSGTGNYTISVTLVDNGTGNEIRPDWTSEASPYVLPFRWGEAVAGNLGSGTDVDSFKVTLSGCEYLSIDTSGIKGAGDVLLEVYAPYEEAPGNLELSHFVGRKILWDDDGGAEGGSAGKGDHVLLRSPIDASFRIDVKSATGGAVDGYRLWIARLEDTPGECTHLAF
jgi:hypothetical protein